ncbi:hypothetical protein [Corallibacter sp.]
MKTIKSMTQTMKRALNFINSMNVTYKTYHHYKLTPILLYP